MNDQNSIHAIYTEDLNDRRSMARAASGRRSKRGRSGCNLESDRLTPAQWARKNGPVIIYNESDRPA